MAGHSQKWHDGSSSRNIKSSSNSEGIATIVNKLEKLGRDMKKLKENVYAIQVGCQNCRGAHLDKDCPLKEEVKASRRLNMASSDDLYLSVMEPTQRKAVYADKKISLDNGRHEISISSNKCTQIVQTNDVSPKILPCQLPPKELNPGNFTLPCTIGSLNFYAMADLGASVNVIPKSIFEHLKLARLKKTDMLVEMADMTKRSPIRIVENVLVKIDKFLFPSDFVVMNMLNTRNETMILGRPFLATIHAEIDVFNKEISLGIGGDRVTFDMDKKIHNFTTPIGEIYMINATSNTPSDASSRVEETNDVHNKNNSCNQEQGRSRKKPRKLEFDINLPSTHFCKPVKQILEGELKFWPTCDPNIKECNGGHEIYEMNKEGDLKKWYCYYDDDRKRINGAGLSFLEFLLVKYGENQEKGLIWDERFEEWCINNPNTPTSRYTKVQENLNPRPKDYPFKDWLLTKVGHTNISEPVKKTLLKTWLIDCFQEDVVKDPRERSFDDYKWMFDLEIDQLADEYELGIGKKGHMLDDIWENCRKVQGDNTYWWYDQKLEEEERRKLRINIEEYEPPMVHVETFEVKG
ncbi:reverse transcriptase domain-containing protein [Tanacetum coccineum]